MSGNIECSADHDERVELAWPQPPRLFGVEDHALVGAHGATLHRQAEGIVEPAGGSLRRRMVGGGGEHRERARDVEKVTALKGQDRDALSLRDRATARQLIICESR